MRNEVITNRQNPRRLAEVFSICCDVVFAISFVFISYYFFVRNGWLNYLLLGGSKLNHNLTVSKKATLFIECQFSNFSQRLSTFLSLVSSKESEKYQQNTHLTELPGDNVFL